MKSFKSRTEVSDLTGKPNKTLPAQWLGEQLLQCQLPGQRSGRSLSDLHFEAKEGAASSWVPSLLRLNAKCQRLLPNSDFSAELAVYIEGWAWGLRRTAVVLKDPLTGRKTTLRTLQIFSRGTSHELALHSSTGYSCSRDGLGLCQELANVRFVLM